MSELRALLAIDDERPTVAHSRTAGDRFIGGTVFHIGPGIIEPAPGIVALPICALWGTTPAT